MFKNVLILMEHMLKSHELALLLSIVIIAIMMINCNHDRDHQL